MALKSGDYLGRYKILSLLGYGGMGEVYRATDSELNRDVAIKVLSADFSTDKFRLNRFKQEGQALAKLNHPNILTILDAGTHEGSYYVVSELLEGETLRERLNGPKLSPAETLEYALNIAQGLVGAHEKGIIHRDLKPENIFLTTDGQVKILDFGLAKLTSLSLQSVLDTEADTIPIGMTQPSIIMGTVGYMSPEQAEGKSSSLDQRSDIFSFGSIFYEMLTGKHPFRGDSNIETLHAIVKDDPGPLSVFNPDIDPALESIVRRCLEKRPEARYDSARDLVAGLKRFSENSLASRSVEESGQRSSNQTLVYSRDRSVAQADSVTQQPARAYAADLARLVKRHQKIASLILAVLILTMTTISYLYFKGRNKATINSIAVLPFVNDSNDPEMDYLSDGITESIINNLSQLPDFAVIARSSVFRYKGQEMNPQVIGQRLGVDAVLMGRIVQRGNSLTISAELVDASNNHQIWGEQYNLPLSDLIAVQSEISKNISDQLRLKLTSEEEQRLTKHYTENNKAYQLYLRGRYHWNKRTGDDIKKSIDYFQQAIAEDPNFALPYAGLADSYLVIGVYSNIPVKDIYRLAKAAALKALEIDQTLAEAHTSLAVIMGADEWNLAGSEAEFRQAIKLNPSYATAHQWFAETLICERRDEEAIAEIKKAQELDPLSLVTNTSEGVILLQARRYDQAIEQLRRTIDIDKNFYLAHRVLRDAYLETGRFDEALAEHQIAITLAGENPQKAADRVAVLRKAYEESGARGYWQKRLDLALEDIKQGSDLPSDVTDVSPYNVASLYARLGQKEMAIQWLQKAVDDRDFRLFYIKTAPHFDDIRTDPRVAEFVRRIGLSP